MVWDDSRVERNSTATSTHFSDKRISVLASVVNPSFCAVRVIPVGIWLVGPLVPVAQVQRREVDVVLPALVELRQLWRVPDATARGDGQVLALYGAQVAQLVEGGHTTPMIRLRRKEYLE